jgi:hypothetical protein
MGITIPYFTVNKILDVALMNAFAGFRDFSILCAMYWAASRGIRRPFLHPFVLTIFALCLLYGLLGASKQGLLTPVFIYALGALILDGERFKYIFVALIPFLLLFQLVLGPVADKMKSQIENLSYWDRSKVMLAEYWSVLLHPQINADQIAASRATYEQRNDYFFQANLGYVERMCLLKTGDKLIYATSVQGHTGWNVILWDLSCFPPRFITPNKPTQSSTNQLARFSGMLGDEDFSTSVSFGIFPQIYHAIGYLGILFLTCPLITAIFWWFRCFVGDNSNMTFQSVVLVALLQHVIAEDVLAAFLNFFYTPLITLFALLPGLLLGRLFGKRTVSTGNAGFSRFST